MSMERFDSSRILLLAFLFPLPLRAQHDALASLRETAGVETVVEAPPRVVAVSLELAAHNVRKSLAEIFADEKIKSVFNGDAGSGLWQKNIIGMNWLESDPVIIGFDLPVPRHYSSIQDDKLTLFGAAPSKDWRDILVLTDPRDARFPKPGTVDLAHVAFMDMQNDWRTRLRLYRDLVRPGGFFVIAHSHGYDGMFRDPRGSARACVRETVIRAFLEAGDWKLDSAFEDSFANGGVPKDYPRTEWWDKFEKAAERGKGRLINLDLLDFETHNFLLVFRKQRIVDRGAQ